MEGMSWLRPDEARGGQALADGVGGRSWFRCSTTLTLLLAGPVAAAPAQAPQAPPHPVTTSYENPLAPDIPGDGTVDSCADPMVIQGQDGETIDGEQVWYMYCTPTRSTTRTSTRRATRSSTGSP